MKTNATGRTEEGTAKRVAPQPQSSVETKDGSPLQNRVSSEIWNATVREEVVADVKARLSRGELDLSPDAIARAIMSGS
ncbi:flagellar biosynthesis anti-sigma factor FlgM [bacterium]|nr:MAG: flagellar biosynthesis anti-sigma factor FlgM [bacterium]